MNGSPEEGKVGKWIAQELEYRQRDKVENDIKQRFYSNSREDKKSPTIPCFNWVESKRDHFSSETGTTSLGVKVQDR